MTHREGETITVDHAEGTAAPRLLLSHRRGIEELPLAEGCELCIGRSEPADIVLDDPSLSRQHAVVCYRAGCLEVRDKGSKNGIMVNGRLVEQAVVGVGDEVLLGEVRLLVLGGGGPPILDHARFVEHLERELVRARYAGTPRALLLLEGAGPLAAWLPQLRGVVLAATYAPKTAEVLLEQTQEAELRGWLSGHETVRRCGAALFPEHGGSAEDLLTAAADALARASAKSPLAFAELERQEPVIASPSMQALYETARRAARTTLPILLLGETGVGKEVLARAIHEASPRRDEAFVALNCAALAPSLLESELFGHERGAFTGAERRHEGAFGRADGGTLFLDEVGELVPAAQAALLRVLAEGELTPLGAEQTREVDVRVLAATNQGLKELVAQGAFRADLYYRLDVMTLELPPLRERREEIGELATRFVELAARRHGTAVLGLSPAARARLEAHSWPGNVRELRNVLERAAALAGGPSIDADDLPPALRSDTTANAPEDGSFRQRLQDYELELITEALRACHYNQSEAARRLNMPLRTMVRKIKSHGLSRATTTSKTRV